MYLFRPLIRVFLCCVLLLGLSFSGAALAAPHSPAPARLLYWSPAEQLYGYRNMEKIFPHVVVPRGAANAVFPLPKGKPLPGISAADVEAFMRRNKVSGLLVLHRGAIVLEQYRNGLSAKDRWTSFSMAKSITSLLVGCALRDGLIGSLDDPVSRYVHELAVGAYAGVSIRQLLTMTSGVGWSEKYADPGSNVAQLARLADDPKASFLGYMAKLPRKAAPGTVFNYSTGEANLIGHLVRTVTGKGLGAYFSEKIWAPMSMEQDAIWVTDRSNKELSGCCFSAGLHDYGRLGLFMLGGGKAGGKARLPEGWIARATTASAPSKAQGRPYGYQLWVRDSGSYQASGIFGQMLHVDPKRELVIVMLSSWGKAVEDKPIYSARLAFVAAAKKAVGQTGKK